MRLKTEQEIKLIAEGGHILAGILRVLEGMLRPGLTTAELEKTACEMMASAGARPSFKGYKANKKDTPFPTALCISINHQVVHGTSLPSRNINSGDIVSIDLGMEYKGFFTDMASTTAVGPVPEQVRHLIAVTKKSLELGIKSAKAGNSLYTLGKTIEDYVEKHGFSVVRELVGHGVGHAVHEQPQIPNYAIDNNKKEILDVGMVIAIEPMVNIGKFNIKVAPDKWTIITSDGSLSAHFEHTVAITKNGPVILTQ